MTKKQLLIKKILILALVFIAVLTVIGSLVHTKHQHLEQQKNVSERLSKNANSELLRSQNYAQYQIELTDYANSYTDKGKYDQTERVLKQIINDVPQKDISSDTYRSYWYLYSVKKDNSNRKHYAQLTAEKLKQEGKPQQAAQFEKDAGTN
jgi:hypothetical protein